MALEWTYLAVDSICDSICRGYGLLISLFQAIVWPLQKPNGLWWRRVVHYKLNQVISQTATVVLNMTSLLEEINITLSMWYVVIDQPNVFSILIRKKYEAQFPFIMTLYYQHLTPGLVNSSFVIMWIKGTWTIWTLHRTSHCSFALIISYKLYMR